MLNDLTGGPVQAYLSLFEGGYVGAKMAVADWQYFSVRLLARRRLLRKVPELRLHIDGITYH